MAVTHMRRSGGSRIMTVPAAVVDSALEHGLALDGPLDIRFDAATKAIVVSSRQPRYTLAELLAECDSTATFSAADRAWLADGPVGSEAI